MGTQLFADTYCFNHPPHRNPIGLYRLDTNRGLRTVYAERRAADDMPVTVFVREADRVYARVFWRPVQESPEFATP